jgi:hypothetical protein
VLPAVYMVIAGRHVAEHEEAGVAVEA